MKKVLERTCQVYNITEDKVKGDGRTDKQVKARMAYTLALTILNKDIHEANRKLLKFSHVMPSYFLRQAMVLFGKSVKFRNRVKEIVDKDDKFEQFANRNPLQVVEAATAVVKEQTKGRVDYPRSEHGKKLHSFDFSADEEIEIAKACEGALEYFEKYGKGYEPDRVLMVNKKRYLR